MQLVHSSDASSTAEGSFSSGTSHPTRDGTCIRDFVHVDDLVAAHVLSLNYLSNPPETFNIGTGMGVSIREFVEACKRATGQPVHVAEEQEARPGDLAEVRRPVWMQHFVKKP